MSNRVISILKKYFQEPPKIIDADKIKGDTEFSSEDAKLFRTMGTNIEDLTVVMQKLTQISFERHHIYNEIDRAVLYPLIGAALELYADTATTYNPIHNATIWITSDIREYERELNNMLSFIGIEEKIFDWAWTTAAFGDMIVGVEGFPNEGIVSVNDDFHPLRISRVDIKGRLVGFYETPFFGQSQEKDLRPPWEYIHYRTLGVKRRRSLHGQQGGNDFRSSIALTPDIRQPTSNYGSSVILNALPIHKRLKLAEDSLMLARLSKTLTRNIYKVKVTGKNMDAMMDVIDSYAALLKRSRAMDIRNESANFEDRYQELASNEDVILPVWDDVNDLQIDTLGGKVDIKYIVDVVELRNLLAAALRTPLQLLGGFMDELPASLGQSSLATVDVRFARAAKRLQRALIEGTTRLAQVHLAFKGMNPDTSLFSVHMAETSAAEEEEVRAAADAGVETVDKVSDVITKMLGDDVDNEKLLNFLNTKFLKFKDLDLNSLKKSDVKEAIDKKKFKKPIKEKIHRKTILDHNTDLRALLPDKEYMGLAKGNLNETWDTEYKGMKVKVKAEGKK